MHNLQKIGTLFFLLLLGGLGWYLVIKPNDFEVVIKAKTSPGTVYKSVLDWNEGLNKSNVATTIRQAIPFNKIVHDYNFESHQLLIDWEIAPINDSITKTTIKINDSENSLKTRIGKLLGDTPLEQLINREFAGFNSVLVNHLAQFSVAIDGQKTTPEAFVAYVNSSCHQDKKADNMIMNSTYINSFLQANNIKVLTHPFLEIVNWEVSTGQVNFNFCFPIEQGTDLPSHEEIKFKKVTAQKAIKATFHGNYTYTDEAWYTLYQYANKKQLKRKPTIREVFYENPHTSGLRDIDWEAAIYMEIE